MIRLEVIEINTSTAATTSNIYKSGKKEEKAKVENFIVKVGYENIRNIIVSASDTLTSVFYIFYEDGLPDTPYVEEEPPKKDKKKGIFG